MTAITGSRVLFTGPPENRCMGAVLVLWMLCINRLDLGEPPLRPPWGFLVGSRWMGGDILSLFFFKVMLRPQNYLAILWWRAKLDLGEPPLRPPWGFLGWVHDGEGGIFYPFFKIRATGRRITWRFCGGGVVQSLTGVGESLKALFSLCKKSEL